MRTLSGIIVVLVAALSLPAIAGADEEFRAKLSGFKEVPAVSTTGKGQFRAERDGDTLEFHLTYSDLEGALGSGGIVTGAHIHLGQEDVNGGIVIHLCGGGGTPPTAACPGPVSGTVTGTLTAVNVVAVPTQGIAAGELDEVLRAMRRGLTYVNVHTTRSPGGEIRGQIKRDRDDD